MLAAITWMGAVAALARTVALALTLGVPAAGSILLAIGWAGPIPVVLKPAGDVLVASAVLAFYSASALLLESSFQRPVLPVGQLWPRVERAAQSAPFRYGLGEPGVRAGQ